MKPNVSFHLCLQGLYVLTVAHLNKTGFNFTLMLKVVGPVAFEASVFPQHISVMNWNLRGITAKAPGITALLDNIAAGMNPVITNLVI